MAAEDKEKIIINVHNTLNPPPNTHEKEGASGVFHKYFIALIGALGVIIAGWIQKNSTPTTQETSDNNSTRIEASIKNEIEYEVNRFIKTKDLLLKKSLSDLFSSSAYVYQSMEGLAPIQRETDIFIESLENLKSSSKLTIDSVSLNEHSKPIYFQYKIN